MTLRVETVCAIHDTMLSLSVLDHLDEHLKPYKREQILSVHDNFPLARDSLRMTNATLSV